MEIGIHFYFDSDKNRGLIMKVKKMTWSFFLGLSFLSVVAQAGEKKGIFFIEPDVGYALKGTLKAAGAVGDDTLSGLSVGARAGVRLGRVFVIGPSVKYLPSVTYTPYGTGIATSPKPTLMTAGGFIGLWSQTFPIRIWGGYNVLDELTQPSGTDATLGDYSSAKVSGSSFFVGVGFKLIGVIQVNGELVLPTYKKFSASYSGTTTTSTLTDQVTGKYGVVSLSAPLSF